MPDPTFTPPAGTYISAQTINLADSSSAPYFYIYYTTDGTTPVPGVSNLFYPQVGILVSSSEAIKAIAVTPGYTPSNVVSAAYAILPPPGFTTGPGATTSMTVTPGSTSGNTGTVSVVGTNGFSGTANLTCSVTTAMIGVNDMPTCSLSPTSVTISGTAAQTSTLTAGTTATTSSENRLHKLFWPTTSGVSLALMLFLILPRRRRSWLAMVAVLVLFAVAGLTACSGSGGGGGGGGGNSGTTVGTYTITVTGSANSGAGTATISTIALTVN
jgi:hypothetical protein